MTLTAQTIGSDVGQWTVDHGRGTESTFAWQSTPVRFGLGATEEVGHELARLGASRVLVVTDSGLMATGLPDRVRQLVRASNIDAQVWDGVDVEPTDVSIRRARTELAGQSFDAFVGVGGGSSLDTCKLINLFLSCGGDLEDFMAAPHGAGLPISAPLHPMIGIPTTAGTGSECSAVAIVNLTDRHVKGAVSDSQLRPTVAMVDPLNTVSAPSWVTASAGYDALVQTLESYTSTPFNRRERSPNGAARPLYAGSTPISDVWNEKALSLLGRYLERAIRDPDDIDARTGMALGALFSRMGTAGAHIPHSAAYAVAGLVKSYRPPQFGPGPALVPHGMSVVVTAPAAFDYTYETLPERHERAARLVSDDQARDAQPDEALGLWLRDLRAATGGPSGLDDFGFTPADIPDLVARTLTQARLLAGAPRMVDAETLTGIFKASFSNDVDRAENR